MVGCVLGQLKTSELSILSCNECSAPRAFLEQRDSGVVVNAAGLSCLSLKVRSPALVFRLKINKTFFSRSHKGI